MFHDELQSLQQEISGEAARAYVAEIARYHRIQASPGYRRAAEYVRDEVAKVGVQAEILSFAANNRTRYWGARMFQEWDCEEGVCYLVTGDGPDRKLADYREDKISIIQRSRSGDIEAEVLAVDGGAEDADYAGLDLDGKVVLVRNGVGRAVELAVRSRGAVGVLYDGMRSVPPIADRIDYPDVLQYTSFWARGGGEIPLGFVLTPRQGDALRLQIKEQAKQGKPPLKVRMHVRSTLYDGAIEVVSCLLPGSSKEEIVLAAHLCHPQACANDNGSGSAVLMEIARALSRQIRNGSLRPLKRSIRFLWMPEMTGTNAYLATYEADIPKMIAGLNLDMVGEDQDLCRSVFSLVRPPLAMASFVPAVLEWVLSLIRDSPESPYSAQRWPTFRVLPVPFSAGSDHYIMSDPTVGVPTPMLNCHPDKYHHTNADTMDKVDPRALGFASTLSAAYAYWLATAGLDEACWLADEMTTRFKKEILSVVQAHETAHVDGRIIGPSLEAKVGFLAGCHEAALTTLKRLAELDTEPWQTACATFCEGQLAQATACYEKVLPARPSPVDEWESRAAAMVPKRVFRGPVGDYELSLSPEDQEELQALSSNTGDPRDTSMVLAMYWTDGKRTLQQICDQVELESGHRSTQLLVRYYELLARAGVITL